MPLPKSTSPRLLIPFPQGASSPGPIYLPNGPSWEKGAPAVGPSGKAKEEMEARERASPGQRRGRFKVEGKHCVPGEEGGWSI
jgi:hypothetical protein